MTLLTALIRQLFSKRFFPYFAAALGVLLLLSPAGRLRSENFVVYLPNQRKLIPIENIAGARYMPLIPLLSLRGQLSGLQEKRNSLKVWVGTSQLQFHLNRTKVQVDKFTVTLPQPILRSNGEWMAPESFISGVLPEISGAPILYQPGTSRIFIGDVRPLSYTVRVQNLPSGARLEVQFTGPVAAQSASSNGKWLLYLGGEAIEPLEPSIRFENAYVKELRFDDQDGRPKLIITPAVEGLNFYPVMTPDRQTLIADFRLPPGAAPPQSASGGRSAPAAGPGAAGLAASPAATKAAPPRVQPAGQPSPAPPPPLPAIALDAGHGGADAGARSRDGILEKNLAAVVVQQVAAALGATHKYRVLFTRSGDSDPSIAQRTVASNIAQPIAFLTFHAGEMGDQSPVIRVYTYEPPSPFTPDSSTPRPASLFVPWDQAQQAAAAKSVELASLLALRFATLQGTTAPPPVAAPVRQLRSIAAPAVAIEMGSLSPDHDAGPLAQPAFQKQVADAVAAALEQFSPGGAAP